MEKITDLHTVFAELEDQYVFDYLEDIDLTNFRPLIPVQTVHVTKGQTCDPRQVKSNLPRAEMYLKLPLFGINKPTKVVAPEVHAVAPSPPTIPNNPQRDTKPITVSCTTNPLDITMSGDLPTEKTMSDTANSANNHTPAAAERKKRSNLQLIHKIEHRRKNKLSRRFHKSCQ